MVNSRIVKVKRQFDEQGREIVAYIRQKSEQNSQKFIYEVDKVTDQIKQTPKAFPQELNLPSKYNWYRFAIVMKSWKIVFKVTDKYLVFLSIVYAGRHPREVVKLRTSDYS
ncbi:MAG: hypothetical protein DRJ05_08845 [Bacteroidetes bacterium]|nr:MAG: hypothetical protein DRJ05_08845 [Bacteroidota bacterium]